VLGVLLVVFAGNLDGMGQLARYLADIGSSSFQSALPGLQTAVRAVSGLREALGGQPLPVYNYWDPTRVIPATINEFPYFSFLFADLHPHMIGLPFTVFFLSLVYAWLRPRRLLAGSTASLMTRPGPGTWALESTEPMSGVVPARDRSSLQQPLSFWDALKQQLALSARDLVSWWSGSNLWRWLALPFALGALAIINTWDLPTYLGLMGAAFLLGRFRGRRPTVSSAWLVARLVEGALFGAALLVVTYLLYLPFFRTYQTLDVGLGLVRNKTPLDLYFKLWGLFLVIVVSWLWISLRRPQSRSGLLRTISLVLRRWNVAPHLAEISQVLVFQQGRNGLNVVLKLFGLVLAVSAGLAGAGYTVPALLLPLVVAALLLLPRWEVTAETAFVGLLVFTGLLVLFGVEIVFLRDFLGGGEYYRMNTLFKFFIQVWVLFGVVGALILGRLWFRSFRWHWLWRSLWQISVALLLSSSLIYPVLATRVRVNDRFPGNRPPIGTLDGLEFMTVGRFEWPAGSPIELAYDYDAIRWLQQNVQGTPVIAEAKIGYYREMGMRVAAYTGLPSVTGGLHQDEQHYPVDVGRRHADMDDFWRTLNPERVRTLLDEYDIDYIYAGQVERHTYGAASMAKFDTLVEQGKLELVYENEQTKVYRRVAREG
jgi:YYY domain-containing protein